MSGFDHAVAWREFRPVDARPSGTEDAYIKADKRVDYDYAGSGSSFSVTGVTASVRVNHGESWVVRGMETDALRTHEQGHFDITALGMREEHDRTARLRGSSAEDLSRQYEALRSEINAKIRSTNIRYDTQTRHSEDVAAQRRWNASIAAAKRSSTGKIDDLPS